MIVSVMFITNMSDLVVSIDHDTPLSETETPLPFKHIPILNAALDVFKGENTTGKKVKSTLKDELFSIIEQAEQFRGGRNETDEALLLKKLFRFRPRLIGAIAAYCSLKGLRYSQVLRQNGLDGFYLFWALGSIQDDFIDEIPKSKTIGTEFPYRRGLIGKAIFGGDKIFYRAAHYQLRRRLRQANLGNAQEQYILGRISHWYKFLAQQEADILNIPGELLTFEICRRYREEQNLEAGSVLVAILNGKNCLNSEFKRIEPLVAQFSFLTQIIDDIADIAEDLSAMRPSYAVGALVSNPKELEAMQTFIAKNPNIKMTPSQFRKIAHESYLLIHKTFKDYCQLLEKGSGQKGLTRLAHNLYRFYPHIRNVLYRVNSNFANF